MMKQILIKILNTNLNIKNAIIGLISMAISRPNLSNTFLIGSNIKSVNFIIVLTGSLYTSMLDIQDIITLAVINKTTAL